MTKFSSSFPKYSLEFFLSFGGLNSLAFFEEEKNNDGNNNGLIKAIYC
jgi:hypothetical protein